MTDGGSVRRFLYDGHTLISEHDGANANVRLRRYVHGPGTDEPVAYYQGSALGLANRTYPHQDERGSVAAIANANGALNAANKYDEYGVPQGTLAGRLGYTGQMWLPELGLSYYRARMYNPQLGRFMQTDPIGYGDGMNMYAYVVGDPVNARDPSGMLPCNTAMSRIRSNCDRGSSDDSTPQIGTLSESGTDSGGSGGSGDSGDRRAAWEKLQPLMAKLTRVDARWIPPGMSGFGTEKEAVLKWHATFSGFIQYLPERFEMWSGIVFLEKGNFGVTFPHLRERTVNRFGDETWTFSLAGGEGKMSAHIHSHERTGPRGFTRGDIDGLRGGRFNGYVSHELEECPFTMTARRAGTADEGEGTNICTGTRR